MNEENVLPPKDDVIEAVPMSDAEIAAIKDGEPEFSRGTATEQPQGGFYYKKVVFAQSPDGAGRARTEPGTGTGGAGFAKPPVVLTWLSLFVAWLFYSSAAPFTVFLGIPANILALGLALISLTRGAVGTGVLVLLFGTAGSVIVYLVGLLRFLSQ